MFSGEVKLGMVASSNATRMVVRSLVEHWEVLAVMVVCSAEIGVMVSPMRRILRERVSTDFIFNFIMNINNFVDIYVFALLLVFIRFKNFLIRLGYLLCRDVCG